MTTASTDPFFQEWQRFLHGEPLTDASAAYIRDSWLRCRRAGLDPQKPLVLRHLADEAFAPRRAAAEELIRVAGPHLKWAMASLAHLQHAIILADADGVILYSVGTAPALMEAWGLLPGYDYSEAVMGTNGIGTALMEQQPVMVAGATHYCADLHPFTCVASPIRSPGGRVIGALDICTAATDTNAERLVFAAHLAYMIERELAAIQASQESWLELQRHSLLLEASSLLLERLELEDVPEVLTRVSVPRFADGCLVWLDREFGGRQAIACEDSQLSARLQDRLATAPSWQAIVHGAGGWAGAGVPVGSSTRQDLPAVLQDVVDGPCLVVPLGANGRGMGVVVWWWQHSPIDEAAEALGRELAQRASLALAKAALLQLVEEGRRRLQRQVSMASHELRNALNIIGAGLKLIEISGDGPDRPTSPLRTIRNAATRMLRFLNDLRDQAGIDEGRLSVNLVPRAVQPIVQRAVDEFAPMAKERHVYLEVRVAPGLPEILGDADRLSQVLTNLMTNALNVSTAGTTIRVAAGLAGEWLRIAVQDEGRGIPESQLPHIFEPYWRSPEATGPGSGLGLSICQGIVAAHGGEIRVHSEVGQGSTFEVLLPLPPARP